MADQLTEILLKLEELKFQYGRLVSDRDSEKDTIKRRNEDFDKKINAIRELIEGKDGLRIQLDRLEQERQNNNGLWTKILAWSSVAIVIIKTIYDTLKK